MIYFSEAIKILKNYYNSYQQIKEKPIILGTEIRFQILLENKEKKCVLAGIIDRVDKNKQEIEIIDYKTAKRLPSQQDIDNSLQLSLYCLGLMKRWPQFSLDKIKLNFYYLKHQEILTTTRTKEQLDKTKELVWDKLTEIEKSDFKPKGKPSKHRKQQIQLAKMITKERATRLEGSFGKEKEHYHLISMTL